MKRIFQILAVSCFAILSSLSFATEGSVESASSIGSYPVVVPAGPQPKEGSKPGVKFREVSFAVSNLKQVIETLDKSDIAAGNAISENVILQVHERIRGAVVLINHILISPKISEKNRSQYLKMIVPELGELIFYVMRHHGEDKLNDIQSVSQAKYVLNEFLLDVSNFISFRKSVLNETVWGPMDRANRDELSELTGEAMGHIITGALQNMEDSNPLKGKTSRFWVTRILEKALLIRGARVNAQKITALTYMGIAVWGLLAPAVDVVGLIDGRSENSLFVSSIGYFSLWVGIASLKAASISTNTIDLLLSLKKGFEDPNFYQRRSERSLSLIEKMSGRYKNLMCQLKLQKPSEEN